MTSTPLSAPIHLFLLRLISSDFPKGQTWLCYISLKRGWWENTWWENTDLQIKEKNNNPPKYSVFNISCLNINIWSGQTLETSEWVLIPHGLLKGHILYFHPTWCIYCKCHCIFIFIFLRINQANNYALVSQLIQEVKVKHGPVCPFW